MGFSSKTLKVVILFAGVAAFGALTVALGWRAFQTWGVALHQRSVTRYLAEWGHEASQITNDVSAIHSAEMLGYIDRYYVPGPGYRGPAAVEAELEKQRRESMQRIIASLEKHTGLKYGTNVDRWIDWAKAAKFRTPDDPPTTKAR